MKSGKILIIFLVILITSVGVVSAGTFDLIEESSQSQSQSLDGIFEDIGGDGILKLNISYCNKLDERNIPDGSFTPDKLKSRVFEVHQKIAFKRQKIR